jgi:Zinc-ribbon/Ring finger domain
MKCTALQPAEDRCNNPNCESYRKPFAKYFCRICHLYDDRSRPIFHCPYCNTCRMGLGLGIDFRHCMRCNACVSLADDDHRCIPQKLQGSCPICHESMFSSTEPLRGLKCGHVMHLSCFTMYRRGTSYTCPLCQRSMEDMKDHFALLDAAVRMQPMPTAYLSTVSNIYCQDCGKTGQVQVRAGRRVQRDVMPFASLTLFPIPVSPSITSLARSALTVGLTIRAKWQGFKIAKLSRALQHLHRKAGSLWKLLYPVLPLHRHQTNTISNFLIKQ